MDGSLPDITERILPDVRERLLSEPIRQTLYALFEIVVYDVRIYWALNRHKALVSRDDSLEPEEAKRLLIRDLNDMQTIERRTKDDLDMLCQVMPAAKELHGISDALRNVGATAAWLAAQVAEIDDDATHRN